MLWFGSAELCQTALNKQTCWKRRAAERTRRRRWRRNTTAGSEMPLTLDYQRKTKWLKVPCLCSRAAGCHVCWYPPSDWVGGCSVFVWHPEGTDRQLLCCFFCVCVHSPLFSWPLSLWHTLPSRIGFQWRRRRECTSGACEYHRLFVCVCVSTFIFYTSSSWATTNSSWVGLRKSGSTGNWGKLWQMRK